MPKEKNLHIESLRGLAILLIVMGHVIGSTPEGGMQIDYPSPWRYFYLCSVYIRLPLITAIAGWVYALKPIKKEYNRFTFIQTKFYRLLVPMFTVGSIYFIIQYLIPGTNRKEELSAIWQLLIFPYTYFWYLYSLFLLMVIIALIDMKGWADSFKGWLSCLVISILLAAAEQTIIPYSVPNLFSFKGTLMLLPFFVMGVGINRYAHRLSEIRLQKIYIILSIIGLILLQVEWFYSYGNYTSIYNSLLPVFTLPLLALLFFHMPIVKPLVWVGHFSYSIYLYHGFGTAGGRIISSYLQIDNQLIVFLFASTIALIGPVIWEKIIIRSKFLRFFLLGKK